MENDILKIKENAIKMQRDDLMDTIKSIEAEAKKSSFALVFASSILVFANRLANGVEFCIYIIFVILLLSSIVVAFYNISSKKVKIHADVDEIFVKKLPKQWESHLDNKHLFLRKAYQDAKMLLYKKAILTKVSYFLIILATLIILIYKI